MDEEIKISADYYSIMFKNYPNNKMKYGRKIIDFQDGSLICMAPNQVIEIDKDEQASENIMGWVNFSASYLSDLLKKETGKNAQDHIHFYLIEEAKSTLT